MAPAYAVPGLFSFIFADTPPLHYGHIQANKKVTRGFITQDRRTKKEMTKKNKKVISLRIRFIPTIFRRMVSTPFKGVKAKCHSFFMTTKRSIFVSSS